jgi:heterodisulfide reductase subunit A
MQNTNNENHKDGKTILFLCKCGPNISNFVDFEPLKDWAKEQGDVNVLAISNLLCAPNGKKFFSEVVKNRNIKSIIVAACSPKLHEKTFQDLASEYDINIGKIQMANIREQCAWVTDDKEEALVKTKTLINAAIKRSIHSKDLQKKTMTVYTDVLIIGGGVAGMQSALMMSKAGRKVYIIEKDISLGGAVIKTEDVAPSMECSPCLLAPILSEIRDDPNVEVLTNAEVSEVLGFFGNFTAKIKKKARFVKDNCIGCEECFTECPVLVDSEFHLGLGKRKAIHMLFPGSVPAAAAIDKENCLHFKDNSCNACAQICPFKSIDFDDEDEEMLIQVGAIVVATGFQNPQENYLSSLPLGYKKIENVLTNSEFERLASSNGPTGGKIHLKNGDVPSSIAVIHCAGSMNGDGIPYCSKICCTNALKVGEFIRKANPDAKVFNIHKDLVFSNPKEYKFYNQQIEKKTKFIYCSDLTSIKVNPSEKEGKITITGYNVNITDVDMVVIVTGLLPAHGTEKIAEMMTLELDHNGFIKPDHEILHETGSILDGVYAAGCITQPANTSASVTQAQAAAGDILCKLIPGREIELEIMTSFIDEDLCAGCKLCLSVCPYKAVIYDKEKKVCRVNEAICRGCGTCTAACPSGASQARHFTNEQIYAEIKGLLYD